MSKDIEILFDPIEHKYYDKQGIHYISVTQLIDTFKPKFDELYWATKKAAERNVPVEQVLLEWDTIRKNSCERGTKTHDFLESSVNNIYDTSNVEFKKIIEKSNDSTYLFKITNEVELYSTPLRDKLPQIFYYLLNLLKQGYTLYAEKRIYTTKYKIAGTIDLFAIRGKEFIIVDWKTNKEVLKFESGYYKKVNGVKTNQWIKTNNFFSYPLNNLMDCKGMVYSLQLSIYARMAELFGLTCRGLVLFHIINNDYTNIKSHNIQYLKTDIDRLFDFRYTKLIKPKLSIR